MEKLELPPLKDKNDMGGWEIIVDRHPDNSSVKFRGKELGFVRSVHVRVDADRATPFAKIEVIYPRVACRINEGDGKVTVSNKDEVINYFRFLVESNLLTQVDVEKIIGIVK